MSDFSTGFLTGFANTMADGIKERDKTARDYFEKQYEIATTVGLENHRKVKTAVEGSVKLANQLQQMGVPKEIIMAVASQDPMGLSGFYDDVTGAQAAGVTLDQAFFDDFVTVSKDFQAPDEDFYTFFKKALSPVKSVAQADPEGFKRDRKGGIFSAFLATNPHGRAREQLDETIVIDGLSASELARYGKGYTPAGADNAPTVTFDYSETKKDKSEDLTITETNTIEKAIEERTQAAIDAMHLNNQPANREEAKRIALAEVRKSYGDLPEVIAYLDRVYGVEKEIVQAPTTEELTDAGIGSAPTKEAATGTTPPPATEGSPVASPPPETAPTASPEVLKGPIDPEQENLGAITIKGMLLTFYSNNDDGTVSYVGPDGEQFDFDPVEVRMFVKKHGTNYKN